MFGLEGGDGGEGGVRVVKNTILGCRQVFWRCYGHKVAQVKAGPSIAPLDAIYWYLT